MPSYCRFRHPGGGRATLAIYNKPPTQAVFGGTALTVNNLQCLEMFYRHEWGHRHWNQAYKTIAAMGAVYLDPVASTDVLGHGFSCAHQTRKKGDVDLGKVGKWPATPPSDKVVVSYPLEFPTEMLNPLANSYNEMLDLLANAYHEMITGKSQLANEPVKWYPELNQVVCTWFRRIWVMMSGMRAMSLLLYLPMVVQWDVMTCSVFWSGLWIPKTDILHTMSLSRATSLRKCRVAHWLKDILI